MAYYTPPQARTYTIASNLSDYQPSSIWNPSPKATALHFNPTIYDPRRNGMSPIIKTPTTAQSWRVISPPTAPLPTSSVTSPLKQGSPPSVKHLTCYFWAKHGSCKWSDSECLYAHHDTGKIANGPMQVEPGKPAVAGKNATTARPVYEDWRGGLDTSNNSNSSRKATIDPEIQEQIRYIAAKAMANKNCNNSVRSSFISQKRHHSETTSPTTANTECFGQASRLSFSENLHWKQMETLAQVTDVLTTIVQYSQDLFDKTAGNLQYEAQALEDIFNDIAPTPANGLFPPVPYLQNLLSSRRNILNTMDELEKMGTAIHDAKVSITKDLEKVNLMSVAPDWNEHARSEGSGFDFGGPRRV